MTEYVGTYQEGIDRARASGIIKRNFRTTDGFAHDKRITDNNSRLLGPTAEKILRAWPASKSPRILEIGPGVGPAVSTMSILRPDATIHTAGGLTLINPYWRFNKDFLLGEAENTVAATLHKRLSGLPESHQQSCYSPDELMQIQQEFGIRIFDVLEQPYIHYQCGDQFPEYSSAKGPYDFIFEQCGPNWHRGGDSKVHDATYKLLSPEGILCMNSGSPVEEAVDGVRQAIVVRIGKFTLTINPENFLYQPQASIDELLTQLASEQKAA
jgi:hypothetical protein